MPSRVCNQTVRANLPLFKTADAHAMPGASGASIVAFQRPVKLDSYALLEDTIHSYTKVREIAHEFIRRMSDRQPADRWCAAINRERSIRRKKLGNCGRVLAAPSRSIALGKTLQGCFVAHNTWRLPSKPNADRLPTSKFTSEFSCRENEACPHSLSALVGSRFPARGLRSQARPYPVAYKIVPTSRPLRRALAWQSRPRGGLRHTVRGGYEGDRQ